MINAVLNDSLYSARRKIVLTAADMEALAFIAPLSPDYPGIEHWFKCRVMPGLQEGTRHIVRFDRQGRIAALGIAKAEDGESKICTVRVAPEFRGRGLGVRIFEELMNWLGDERPLASVSEVKIGEFQRVFDHFGYRLTSVRTGLYLPGRSEYFFNESLSPMKEKASNRHGASAPHLARAIL
jgi:GNAT superfamily N-acetyltransferase